MKLCLKKKKNEGQPGLPSKFKTSLGNNGTLIQNKNLLKAALGYSSVVEYLPSESSGRVLA